MKFRNVAAAFATAGVLSFAPAMAQQGGQDGQQAQDQVLAQEQAQQSGANLTVSPTVVRQVQQELNDKGYSAGAVDGNWGQQSSRAMANFQQAQGLEPTGEINQRSLQALGVQMGGGQQQAQAGGGQSQSGQQ